MHRTAAFTGRAFVALLASGAGVGVAAAEKPFEWQSLMTIAQARPNTDLHWGIDVATLAKLHPKLQAAEAPKPGAKGLAFRESVSSGGCAFAVEPAARDSRVLSELTLELAPSELPRCAAKWRARLRALYGKPADTNLNRPDFIQDDDQEIDEWWTTATSCIRLQYTPSGAQHGWPLIVAFGDRRTPACGYDDQIITTGAKPAG